MTEKVKLPKDVCIVLETIEPFIPDSRIVANTADKSWTDEDLLILNKQDADVIMRALVLGYEPIRTPEVQEVETKALWEETNKFPDSEAMSVVKNAFHSGIREALRIHGIHYDWMEDAE